MDGGGERSRLTTALVIGALVVPAVAIGFRIALWSGSAAVGVGAIALFAGFLVGLIAYMRSRVESQLANIEATGAFDIEAALDFNSLPPPWPEKARETLNSAGAGNTPALPVRLAVRDGMLHIDKKQSWGSGRRPFHAEVSMAEIESATVGRSRLGLAGSGLTIQLRNGSAIRADLQANRQRAEIVAEHLRARLPGPAFASAGKPATGIAVTSEDPPVRTPPGRAGGMMMLTMVPFATAMLGAPDGPAAAMAALFLVFYALWGQIRRPPTLNRRLAVGFAVTAVAFVVDTVASGQLWRLIGMVVCLVIASYRWRLRTPSWDVEVN